MSSESRFGWEWDKYHALSENYEEQFRNWTNPLTPKDWKGKRFLDAGCGMGRNSYWPLSWGAASAVAFDNDERSVERAKETLKAFPNVTVLYKSIYDIEWKEEFDIAFSIGVIHHLADPRRALLRLALALKPGGLLLIWVYSYEDNAWIVRYVNPVRIHITSRLPLPIVHALVYLASVPLYLFVKIAPKQSAYLRQLAGFDFWHVHSIVFDQLIPGIANYWRKEEVLALTEGLSLKDIRIEKTPRGTGWILTAIKL